MLRSMESLKEAKWRATASTVRQIGLAVTVAGTQWAAVSDSVTATQNLLISAGIGVAAGVERFSALREIAPRQRLAKRIGWSALSVVAKGYVAGGTFLALTAVEASQPAQGQGIVVGSVLALGGLAFDIHNSSANNRPLNDELQTRSYIDNERQSLDTFDDRASRPQLRLVREEDQRPPQHHRHSG
jgi:hypothetical protein